MNEQWKDITGYEGIYQVSDHGRVRSLDRTICNGRKRKSQILKGGSHRQGYSNVLLYRDRKRQSRLVHRLVLEAFTGPRPEGMVTRHLDGNHTNNHIDNLVWGTSTENNRDRVRHGTMPIGEKNGLAKLCEVDVQLIRDLDGIPQRTIAEWFDISDATVGRIRRRKTWAHI